MSKIVQCSTREYDFQPFPQKGHLIRNMNLPLDALCKRVDSKATVYCYIIATIENREGHFVQTGSAPNFQGDLVTLCTCKHYMRTFLDTENWKGKWIAGFSGVEAGQESNFLVYLMLVAQAFESHHDFWSSEAISSETKRAKAAHLDKFGDIYKPRSKIGNPFDPGDYVSPCSNHVHAQCWHGDIAYRGCSNRVAALLVGDQRQSFLWARPVIYYSSKLHRGQKKCALKTLFAQLKEGCTR